MSEIHDHGALAPRSPKRARRDGRARSASATALAHGGARRRVAKEQVPGRQGAGRGGRFFKAGGAAHSSAREDWNTPPDVVAALLGALGLEAFDLDPCAPLQDGSAVVASAKFTEAHDGLRQRWSGVVFCNPPYGRQASPAWTDRCRAAAESGEAALVVGLLPARTDTGWWHRNVAGNADVLLLRGRLKFGDGRAAAPFPSALVLWGATPKQAAAVAAAFPRAWFLPLRDR